MYEITRAHNAVRRVHAVNIWKLQLVHPFQQGCRGGAPTSTQHADVKTTPQNCTLSERLPATLRCCTVAAGLKELSALKVGHSLPILWGCRAVCGAIPCRVRVLLGPRSSEGKNSSSCSRWSKGGAEGAARDRTSLEVCCDLHQCEGGKCSTAINRAEFGMIEGTLSRRASQTIDGNGCHVSGRAYSP